jgi:hypothetical protein
MDISAEEWEEWSRIFATSIPPRPNHKDLTSPHQIDTLVDLVYTAFNTACTATMKRKGNAPAFSAKWWNDDCRDATAALANAESTEDRKRLGKQLKCTVRIAKARLGQLLHYGS